VLLAIIAGVLIFASYRAAASASFFETRRVDVSGTSRASRDQINAVVHRVAAATGVWRADLQEISAEVEKLPWVRRAIVSRVLPDGLRIRVVERVPLAIVRLSSGKFIWVDEDAVSLSQMSVADQMPAFFIRGWDESGTIQARAENQERIQKYIEMSRDWSSLGLSDRVSEVNLGDPHDIRALLSGNDAQIEVRLGERNLGARLQKALKVLDEQRTTALGPFITYVVASQDGKIIFGYRPGAPPIPVSDRTSDSNQAESEPPATEPRSATATGARKKPNETSTSDARSTGRKKEERYQKEKSNSEANRETRPRRVG
jgi:cell division protein FtsQ